MYWVYDLPSWLLGILIIAALTAYGLGGVELTRRWVPSLHYQDHHYNDIVGFYVGTLTVFYGITLGLLMVAAKSNLSDAGAKVDREAASVGTLFRTISSYPEPFRSQLQDDLRIFTRTVIEKAWQEQRKGIIPVGNLASLDQFQRHLTGFEPVTESQKVLHVEAYHQFNKLVERRRSRIVSSTTGLPGSLWTLVVVGALINITVTWFFHVRNTKLHRLMTILMSSLLGLMIFLLVAMDHPFRGELSVGPEPFEMIYEQIMKPIPEAGGSR
jgi:hypothetical protein